MLQQLLETQAAPQRKPLGTAVSVVLHVALAVAALRVTGRDAVALPGPVEVVVRPAAPRDEPAPARRPPPTGALGAAPTRNGPPVIVPPIQVPIDIPGVDLTAAPVTAADFADTMSPRTRGTGTPDGTSLGDPSAGAPYASFDVEKVAATLPGSPAPSYPEMLKASGIEGEVLAQFVVDTAGRVEPRSFRVLQSSHDGFSNTVLVALPRMRFIPAEAGGRKVRMIVQQRFAFALDR
jgi:protein TonB